MILVKRSDIMAQVMVNFRMDEQLKKKMEETCKNMGITMSAAFTMFATKVAREQRIPFEINADPFYTEANIARLTKIAADLDSGRITLSQHELVED